MLSLFFCPSSSALALKYGMDLIVTTQSLWPGYLLFLRALKSYHYGTRVALHKSELIQAVKVYNFYTYIRLVSHQLFTFYTSRFTLGSR